MEFIDGFVAAVPTANKEEYMQHARDAAVVFKDCGAIRVVECWGEDVPEGEETSFPLAVQCKEDETVVFSWVTWPSKEARDIGMAKMMDYERMQEESMPFDGSRLIYGGFQVMLDE